MLAHKFGWSAKSIRPSRQPVAVIWLPFEDLEYLAQQEHTYKWKVFAQEDLKLTPNEAKTIKLQFCVKLSTGSVLVTLLLEYKTLRLNISNESVVEDCDNIIITLQNNSSKDITIEKGDPLCYLTYVNL